MIKPPATNNISRIADWIELSVLVSEESISKSEILSLLEMNEVDVSEADIDSAFTELSRRSLLYGGVKPFQINGKSVEPTFGWEEYPEHALCLYFSTYGAGSAENGTKLFELVTKACIEAAVIGNGYCFGFPADKPFKDQLDEFAGFLLENRYEDPAPEDKDRGVDIIVYKAFDDSRSNKVLLFIQCAAGKNWNDKKAVSIESYRRFFYFNRYTVVASIALTQVIDIDDWQKAIDDYGIILDRARLFRVYSIKKDLIEAEVRKEIVIWFKDRLN